MTCPTYLTKLKNWYFMCLTNLPIYGGGGGGSVFVLMHPLLVTHSHRLRYSWHFSLQLNCTFENRQFSRFKHFLSKLTPHQPVGLQPPSPYRLRWLTHLCAITVSLVTFPTNDKKRHIISNVTLVGRCCNSSYSLDLQIPRHKISSHLKRCMLSC